MINARFRHILIALAFTVYSVIILMIFNPFKLITTNPFSTSLLLSIGLIFITFILYNLLSKILESHFYKKVIFISSFVVAPILAASISYLILSETKEHFVIYLSSFIVFSLLPFSIGLLYIIFDDLKNKIVISTEIVEKDVNNPLLKLTNDKGKTLFKANLSNIICFEANDNYVITYYVNNAGEFDKSMERISLKKIEEILNQLDASFARVHKSYIVNPNRVLQVRGKAQSHKLQLDKLTNLIPVSRNFDVSVFQEND